MADAFICDGIRTPIGRYGGSLSSIRADDLAASVVNQIVKKNIKLGGVFLECMLENMLLEQSL